MPHERFEGAHAFRHAVGENIGRISLDAAQARLGHTSSKVTRDYYSREAIQERAFSALMPLSANLREATNKPQ